MVQFSDGTNLESKMEGIRASNFEEFGCTSLILNLTYTSKSGVYGAGRLASPATELRKLMPGWNLWRDKRGVVLQDRREK